LNPDGTQPGEETGGSLWSNVSGRTWLRILGGLLALTSLLVNAYTSLRDHSTALNFLFVAGLFLAFSKWGSDGGKKKEPEQSGVGWQTRLSKIQECPYCHTQLELEENEQVRRQFECFTCNEVIDFSDTFDPKRDESLQEKVNCPKCSQLVELDETERLAKRYDCPYCSSHIDYTVSTG